MYENIGGKIKNLAKGIFIIETCASIIGGIVLMSMGVYLVGMGLLLCLIGPAVAWISSWFLYGIGEIIDKLTAIEINTRNYNMNKSERNEVAGNKSGFEESENSNSFGSDPETKTLDASYRELPISTSVFDDKDFIDIPCPECNKSLYLHKETDTLTCPWCDTLVRLTWK